MKKLSYIIASLLLMLVTLTSLNKVVAQDYAVIVNPGNPYDEMTASQVKLFYLRKVKKRWPEINKNIKPVNYSGSNASKETFQSGILKMTNDKMERYFQERQYQNAEVQPPKKGSESDVIKYVEDNIGAIGYVKLSSVEGNSKVKIVYKY